ncbi:TetR/AcrR family transcriptional regulator [Nocardia colli]|uniref:TetR/AcrR family transcriptional regulator n=1 Tax=Nocardia colli TaxID=2545717 RepID=A0A5N0EK95_9NOCA|nr:TetR/AcrR family transcriptional regulator C-terminal domain-containing protein [Nocardia colli]KAA8887801.1 TetR/AcrR family transcriptional regulator [Nocardia colli]
MPRPRSLTKSDLGVAALAVIDRDGLPALTMRAVAKELHMATMALYRYVADREELEVLVVDEVLAGIDVSTPADAHWRDRLAILLERMRAAISAHPATVPLVPRHRKSAIGTRRWMEAMLSVLDAGGFAGPDRVIAQRTLVAFLLGSLENQHYASINAPATTAIAQLSPEEYPMLTQTAAQARKMSVDEEFRGGLRIVLRGLES